MIFDQTKFEAFLIDSDDGSFFRHTAEAWYRVGDDEYYLERLELWETESLEEQYQAYLLDLEEEYSGT